MSERQWCLLRKLRVNLESVVWRSLLSDSICPPPAWSPAISCCFCCCGRRTCRWFTEQSDEAPSRLLPLLVLMTCYFWRAGAQTGTQRHRGLQPLGSLLLHHWQIFIFGCDSLLSWTDPQLQTTVHAPADTSTQVWLWVERRSSQDFSDLLSSFKIKDKKIFFLWIVFTTCDKPNPCQYLSISFMCVCVRDGCVRDVDVLEDEMIM